MADLWAVEVRLTEMSMCIASVADRTERAKRIVALIRCGFMEGAYRHFLDHKDTFAARDGSQRPSFTGETMQQIQLPPLAEGEIYLRGFVNANGEVEHTILLPGDNDGASWQEQMDWAKSIGGDLPTRAELAIAYEQHRDQFQQAAYWSNTPDDDPEYAGWAWFQDFMNGGQYGRRHSSRLRARAVRRLSI